MLSYLAASADGNPVYINRRLADADLVIYNYVCRGQEPGIARAAEQVRGLSMHCRGKQVSSCRAVMAVVRHDVRCVSSAGSSSSGCGEGAAERCHRKTRSKDQR